jgi:hypothetical protein
LAKKTKDDSKRSKSKEKTFGKPVDVTDVAGGRMSLSGCGCMSMPVDPASYK